MRIEKGKYEFTERNVSYDLLRIFAASSIVFIHISSSYWYSVDPRSPEWFAMNIYDGMSRGAVPIFFMLSGAFLLKKDIPLKSLYINKIIPLSILGIIWSLFYALYRIGIKNIPESNLTDIIKQTIYSSYQLWFVSVLIGLYIIQPVLRAIVTYKDGDYIRYILLIFIIFNVVKSTSLIFIENYQIVTLMNKIPVELTSYSCYMILGYYLSNVSKRNYNSNVMWLLFIISAFICSYVSYVQSVNSGVASYALYDYFSITSFTEASSLFIIFKNFKLSKPKKLKRIIYNFSSLTFGIYLIHPFIISELENIANLNTVNYNTFLAVPVNTIITLSLSAAITFIMIKIPIIKRIWKF